MFHGLCAQSCTTGVLTAIANTNPDSVTICNGNAVQFELLAPDAADCSGNWEYLWFDGSHYYDGNGFNAATEVWHNSYNSINLSSVTQTATYKGKIRCSIDYTCTDSSVVKVIVNPVPVCDQKVDIEVCCGGLIEIGDFVGNPTGTTFSWINSNTMIGLTSSGTGNILPWFAPANCTNSDNIGVITVSPEYNGCSGPAMSFTITIYPTPQVTQMPDIYVCPGATINIGNFTSTPSGASFNWTNSNTNIGLAANGTGNIPSWTAPTNNSCFDITSTITVMPTLNGCFGPPISFTVKVYPTPEVYQMPNIAVCPGELINVGYPNSCPMGYTYSWTNTNTNIGIAATGVTWNPSWTAPENNTGSNITGTITFTPTLNGCVGPPMSFTVTIYPEPGTPPLVIGQAISNEGTTNSYTVSPVPGAISYIWAVPTGWTIVSGQGTNSVSVITGPAGQNGDITVSAINLCDTGTAYIFPVTSVSGMVSVVSGIINTYYHLTDYCACSNSVTLSSCTGLAVGDKVLLIQMKGAEIDSSNSVSSGSIMDYNTADNYEIAVIDSISACQIFLRDSLINTYNVNGIVQLVRIPQYNDVLVTDTLTCLKWNGSLGGVLIFEAQGNVTLNAPVDVSGKGFAGGVAFTCDADFQNTTPLYVMPSYLGNKVKGEGISALSPNLMGGRGTLANGGGAAGAQPALNGMTDALYNGGGGGGNYGAGGNGGKSSTFYTTQYPGGLGGRALSYSNTAHKIFMGGGGGAGHRKYTTSGPTNGTNGGGIVIIVADSLMGNNANISADGINNQDVLNNTGRGDGGAGVTVLLDVQNYSGALNVSAKGGHGGDNAGGNFIGPGGGGGGGVVWVKQPSLPSGITCNVNGGTSGLQMTYSDPWGATDGAQGATLNSLVLPAGQNIFVPFTSTTNIASNAPVCTGDTLFLTADLVTGIDSFLWVGPNGFVSHSQNPYIPNVSAANAGVYSLYLIDNGCSGPAVTTTVTIFPALSVYAGADTIIWCGTFATLTATVTGGSGSFLYDWSPNVLLTNPHEQNTSTISLNCSVLFIVTVTDSITQCKNTDTVCVIMYCSPPTLFVSAQPDTICTGDSVTLDVTNGCYQPYSYTWSSTPGNFHSTLSNFIVNPVVTTTYTVTATDGFYTNTSSVVVTVTSSLMEYLISSDTMCLSGTTTTISTNGSDTGVYYILYKNGVVLGPPLAGTGSALSWDMLSSGVYYMEAYDSTGLPCGNYFSNTLVIGHHPLVVLGNDTTVCNVFTLTLVGPPGLGYSYTWLRLPDDTLGQSQYLYLDYSTSGLGQYYYTLHVSDSNQCFGADTIGVNFQICPSVHEYGAHFTEVFPNPASTYIEIKTEINHITDIEIINMQGVVVLISPLSSKIDISHLSPGFYILRFSDGTRQYHKKFVKNRF